MIELTAILTALAPWIAGLASALAAYLGYRQFGLGQKTELTKQKVDQQTGFVEDVLERVNALETRVDTLTDKIIDTANKAEQERRALILEYDSKVESVRKDMRRLIDDAHMELSMWRDKYFTLITDYQKIKLEYAALEMRFDKLDKEYSELRALYRRRKGDTTDESRVNPDIEKTP